MQAPLRVTMRDSTTLKSISTVRNQFRTGSVLRRHIVTVLILKAVLLVGLWLAFVEPHRVNVDASAMGEHIAGQTTMTNKENNDDRINRR